jgi:hypothetical protein
MAGERGRQYENAIYNTLLENDLTASSHRPSGSGHEADTAFKIKNKFYKLEVKLDLDVDFGQGTLRYDIDNKTWVTYAENATMKEILDTFEIADFANQSWKLIPYNHYKSSDVSKQRPPRKKLTRFEISEDRKNFPDKYKILTGNKIAEYYNSKDIYYIQIGKNKGFYYMGKDIANLGVPEFNPPRQKIRIRRKGSGSDNYSFATAIIVDKNIPSSLYNLDYSSIFLLNKNV